MEDQRITEKINFFMDEKIEVHVKLRDRTFLNGFIKKELREGVYWFIDRKLTGVYLFAKDIFEIEQIKDMGERLDYGNK